MNRASFQMLRHKAHVAKSRGVQKPSRKERKQKGKEKVDDEITITEDAKRINGSRHKPECCQMCLQTGRFCPNPNLRVPFTTSHRLRLLRGVGDDGEDGRLMTEEEVYEVFPQLKPVSAVNEYKTRIDELEKLFRTLDHGESRLRPLTLDGGLYFENRTPHLLRVYYIDRDSFSEPRGVLVSFKPVGSPIRLNSPTQECLGLIDKVPVYTAPLYSDSIANFDYHNERFNANEVIKQEDLHPNIIVAQVVAPYIPKWFRGGVYFPDTGPASAIRDDTGNIVAVRHLCQYRPERPYFEEDFIHDELMPNLEPIPSTNRKIKVKKVKVAPDDIESYDVAKLLSIILPDINNRIVQFVSTGKVTGSFKLEVPECVVDILKTAVSKAGYDLSVLHAGAPTLVRLSLDLS
jgi:hypothetical protein